MVQASAEIRATRQMLRARRRAIPRDRRLAAERAILRHLKQLRVFRPGAKVAVYLAMPGEVSLARGLGPAARAGTLLYAPRIVSRRRLGRRNFGGRGCGLSATASNRLNTLTACASTGAGSM